MSIKVQGFKSSDLLDQVNSQLTNDQGFRKNAIHTVGAAIVFNVKNKNGQHQAWVLDLKDSGKISRIDPTDVKKYDAQIITSDANLKKLIAGKASAQALFMSGRLKLRGDVAKAASVESIFKQKVKAKL
ncbi:hypothetical protein DASC09_011490 [Saccharomycopsis crataegensis]|uniref:SCP2 domain-containing protein n=1 Tax=Saccharomycopsis crataegensis TaxID=43959 RepID=A0AAV5QHI6_9ASCO|nr:hypothetical protein DASC09_011490 [Saccharomycopsis crataegensis]